MPDLACPSAPLHQNLPCLSRKSRLCPTLATGVSSTVGCVPSAGSHSRRWAPGPDSFGTAPALASCGDSLRLPCFSSRPASMGVWSPFVCPCSERRKVLLKSRLLCSHRHTHVTPNQGPCLVYLADVLPEQMGRGNDSLSHFCLHGTPAHPSFSRLASPGRSALAAQRESPPAGCHRRRWPPPTPHVLFLLPFAQRFTLWAILMMKQAPD